MPATFSADGISVLLELETHCGPSGDAHAQTDRLRSTLIGHIDAPRFNIRRGRCSSSVVAVAECRIHRIQAHRASSHRVLRLSATVPEICDVV